MLLCFIEPVVGCEAAGRKVCALFVDEVFVDETENSIKNENTQRLASRMLVYVALQRVGLLQIKVFCAPLRALVRAHNLTQWHLTHRCANASVCAAAVPPSLCLCDAGIHARERRVVLALLRQALECHLFCSFSGASGLPRAVLLCLCFSL